jgi:hypothetical protein
MTISDEAYEAFDYIINTRTTYEMLREALGLLERRAKRNGLTPQEELRTGAYDLRGPRRWYTIVCQTLFKAREDYYKFFAEEAEENCPDWVDTSTPGGVTGPLANQVLAVALEHRYHWST